MSRSIRAWLASVARGVVAAALIVWVVLWLFRDTWTRHRGLGADVAIRFSHFGGYDDFELWRRLLAEFRRIHPEIAVRQEYAPGPAGSHVTKLRQQALVGAMPDVILTPELFLSELREHLAPIEFDEVFTVQDELRQAGRAGSIAWDSNPPAGGSRAVPVGMGTLLIYANRRCFDRATRHHGRDVTMPDTEWTLDQFLALTKDLTLDDDHDGVMDQHALWLPRWVYFLPFTWTLGADYVDAPTGRWTFTDAAARASLLLYRELGGVAPGSSLMSELSQDAAFMTGRVAMCVNGPWFQPFLEATSLADEYAVLPIPSHAGRRVTRITFDALATPRGPSDPRRQASLALIRFLVSRDAQRRLAETGRVIPIRADAHEAFVSGPRGEARRRFIDSLSHARFQPVWQGFARVDRAIQWHYASLPGADSPGAADRALSSLASDPVIVELFGPGNVAGSDQGGSP